MEDLEIKIGGIYKHFKGNEYEVIALARDSETLEEMVVYKGLYEHPEFGYGAIWVRPLKMFNAYIERAEYKGPRFKLIE